MNFTRIAPTDPNLSKILSNLSSARFDYNALARAVNDTEVGGLLHFPFASNSTAIITQLEKRGLKRDADFTVHVQAVKAAEGTEVQTAFVTRTSGAVAAILPPPARVRKPKEVVKAVAPVAVASAAKPQVAAQAKAAQKA